MSWSWFHSTILCPWMEGPRASECAAFLGILPSLFSPVALRLFSPTADVEDPSAITDAANVVEGRLNGMGLNLLINNAGIYSPTASLETVDAEDMVRAYKTNAVGPMLMAQVRVKLWG